MRNTTAEGEICGSAALYALGALEGEEARAFEAHLEEGCGACASELREFGSVVGGLGLAAPEAEPPGNARARLLERLAAGGDSVSSVEGAPESIDTGGAGAEADSSHSLCDEGFLVVRAGEGRWLPAGDAGVSFKLLYTDRERGTFTTLVRMDAGASIPAHRHLGVEQCLVIEGDLRAGGVEMHAGDFNCSLPGSVHEELTTAGGALFLIVGPERYEVVEARA
ncbi:MAG TPA: cupin domain-containing protein [Pyrinomonadaceae bacterium]|nr:cupin domain-containing protein [Pyrinomonadaceae bacterium]